MVPGPSQRIPRWLLFASLCALLVAGLAVVASCGGDGAGGVSGVPALEDINVLLIVIDTLGARHLGCYRPELAHSPRIDRLAAGGVRFSQSYTPAPWTEPAVASLFTSRMPSDHEVLYMFDHLGSDHSTLAELMRERGKRTAGVISHFIIGEEYGFAQGFERYAEDPIGKYTAVTSAHVTTLAMAHLDELADEPFFLFVHYFDPHFFYNHHRRYSQTGDYTGRLHPRFARDELRQIRHDLDEKDLAYLVGLYREEIAYTDHQVGRLLDHLEILGITQKTLVVLTADHGEGFMEHGWIGHTRNLYDELLHVPLILSLPGTLAPRVVDVPASLLDIVPTLLALSRQPAEASTWQGISLWPHITSSEAQSAAPPGGTAAAPTPEPRPLYAEVSFVQPADWPAVDEKEKTCFMSCVRVGEAKLIHDLEAGSYELYDLGQDPGEQADPQDAETPELLDLRQRLTAWEQGRVEKWGKNLSAVEDVDPELIERIRALGYVR